MQPTMKLRWVPTEWHEHLGSPKVETIRGKYVLQQWWEETRWAHDVLIVVAGEWRDIPIEVEE